MQVSKPRVRTDHDALLRPPQAAEYVGVSKSKLAKLRMDGYREKGPPFIKLGASVLYRRRDLDAWLTSNTITSTE